MHFIATTIIVVFCVVVLRVYACIGTDGVVTFLIVCELIYIAYFCDSDPYGFVAFANYVLSFLERKAIIPSRPGRRTRISEERRVLYFSC